MKKLILVGFILLLTKNVYAQETKFDKVLTEKRNIEWITKFEKLNSKNDQIAEIKKKIYADSMYIRQNGYNRIGCKIIIQNEESFQKSLEKPYCECKIVFVLGFKKETYVLDPIEAPKTNERLKLVTDKNIDRIIVLKNDVASIMYGVKGRCGVIVMYSDSRKFKRKIKNIQ